jgi:uncharacterized membrane protein YheB (UPF0754 family)
MSFWLIMLPFFSALFGWLLCRVLLKLMFHPRIPFLLPGISIQGMLPKRWPYLSTRIGEMVNNKLVSSPEIEKMVLNPANLQRLLPEIELHIDHFLRVKLKDAMPMVAMFVGDKTIVQMKEVFMKEMETLFPVIMESYVKGLTQHMDIANKISLKLSSIPGQELEMLFSKTLRKELCYVQFAGILFGFLTGAFQLMIILLNRS